MWVREEAVKKQAELIATPDRPTERTQRLQRVDVLREESKEERLSIRCFFFVLKRFDKRLTRMAVDGRAIPCVVSQERLLAFVVARIRWADKLRPVPSPRIERDQRHRINVVVG